MLSCTSPDAELITYCSSGPHDRIIGGVHEGNLVVRISEQVVSLDLEFLKMKQ
jgi:hypothetical protein